MGQYTQRMIPQAREHAGFTACAWNQLTVETVALDFDTTLTNPAG